MIGRTYCGTVSFDVVLRVTYYTAYIAFALHNGLLMHWHCRLPIVWHIALHAVLQPVFVLQRWPLFADDRSGEDEETNADDAQQTV